MSDNNFKFGVQKPYAPEQLKEETKDLLGKCSLESVGNFYFTCGEELKTRQSWFLLFLKFYDEKKQVLHTSPGGVFAAEKHPTEEKVTAINECTFVLGPFKSGIDVLLLSPDWSSGDYLHKNERKRLLGSLLNSSLSKIRTGTPGDFNLKSQTGDLDAVHTAVFKPLWSSFSAAL